MSTSILIIDANISDLERSKSALARAGFGVDTAQSGQDGLQQARRSQPRVVMIDSCLPDMDWREVAETLHKDPATAKAAIVMLAEQSKMGTMLVGQPSPADDVLIKPFATAEVAAKVRDLLGVGDLPSRNTVVSTGNAELDSKMGGGIPLGSLTLIEGDSGAGKSVLSQQLLWGSLQDGFKAAVFTSENSIKSLIRQMQSLNLDVLDFAAQPPAG